MTLQEFVQKGWADHGSDPEGVFARLPEGLELATEPAHLAQLANLALHVSAELGRWEDGIAFLDRLQSHPAFHRGAPEGLSVFRAKAVLYLAAGSIEEAERCQEECRAGSALPPASERIRVLATAAAAVAAQGRTPDSRTWFREALRLAAYGPDREDPASRALAVSGNNLACELEMRPSRTPEETALMIEAAEAGLRFWSVAGTWLETERAHYRLSNSLRIAGDAPGALEHAERCRAIVEENGGGAFERFYAEEALALARLHSGDREAAGRARDAAAAAMKEIEDLELSAMVRSSLEDLDRALGGSR